MIGQLAFAFLAGSVATVNPCGFALLPAYMARRVAMNDGAHTARQRIGRALAAGMTMTFGLVLVFGIAGGAMALGAGWLTGVFPWTGLLIGVSLAAAGLVVLSGRHIGLSLLPRPSSATGGLRGDFLFGLGFGTASLACTLPIFLAVVGVASTGGALAGVLSVGAYAFGMGTIMVALAVAAALSKTGITVAYKGLLPYLPRIGGAFLFLSGLYVAYFWGYALFSNTFPADGNAIVAGNRISGTLRAMLSGKGGQEVVYGVLALLLVLSAWLLGRRLYSRVRGRPREAGLPSGHRGGLSSSTMED